jgi:hypothetical protein
MVKGEYYLSKREEEEEEELGVLNGNIAAGLID